MGGNADRLGALFAGPLAACVLAGAVDAAAAARCSCSPRRCSTGRPTRPSPTSSRLRPTRSVNASYYAPLLGELRALRRRLRRAPGAHRGGAPRPTTGRPAGVAPPRDDRARLGAPARHATATASSTSSATRSRPPRYRAWLSSAGDLLRGAARRAAGLLGQGRGAAAGRAAGSAATCAKSGARRTGGCSPCAGATPLAQAPARPDGASARDSFTLRRRAPGSYTVRVRFTPYWALAGGHGCVRSAPGGWTRCRPRRAGSVHVVIDFSLARVFDHGRALQLRRSSRLVRRCSPALVSCRRASCRTAGSTCCGRSRCSEPPTSPTGSCAGMVEGDANAAFAHARDLIRSSARCTCSSSPPSRRGRRAATC